MHYLIVSFSHKNSDIGTRERLSMDEEAKKRCLKMLLEGKTVSEAIVVSTCNRLEIVASVGEVAPSLPHIFETLSIHSALSIEELEGRADVYENEGAIHHLFAVASALDSVVIGETQIVGQLKDAYRFAYDAGFCSQKLSRAMHFAFKCAAAVKNETGIAKKPVSVASVAVDKAKKLLGSLNGETAVVIGTGEMGKLACKYLLAAGCKVILVSRNKMRAEEVARGIGVSVEVQELFELKNLLGRHKLLFSATGAQHPIIYDAMVTKTEFKRHWFDISLPRDIEIGDREDIEVITVDDLQDIVSSNMGIRAEEAKAAYSIIGRYTFEFFRWISTLSVDPIIKELRDLAEDAAKKEMAKAVKKGRINKEDEEEFVKVMHSAFKKFLHAPTVNLKALSDSPKLDTVVESLKYLFEMQKESRMLEGYKCEHADKGINP